MGNNQRVYIPKICDLAKAEARANRVGPLSQGLSTLLTLSQHAKMYLYPRNMDEIDY
jgi:hypothetical protein